MEKDLQFEEYTSEIDEASTRKFYQDIYFEYVSTSHRVCRNRITADCSKEVISDLENLEGAPEHEGKSATYIQDYVDQCVRDSWEGPDQSKGDNVILR